MTPKCVTCNHRQLCKYEDKYMETYQKLATDAPDPFSLELNCRHYYTTTCTLNGWYTDCTSNTISRTPNDLSGSITYLNDTIRGETNDTN